jgi:hypothetical protein
MKAWLLCIPRTALIGLAIVGATTAEVLGQAAMPAQAALAEVGLPGNWAQDCARPIVALTFESGGNAQLVIRREKDGVRFDIRSANKIQDDTASLGLRPNAVLDSGKWQAASAADATHILHFIFAKRGNNLVSLWETQIRLGVPAGVYSKCSTLGPPAAIPTSTATIGVRPSGRRWIPSLSMRKPTRLSEPVYHRQCNTRWSV